MKKISQLKRNLLGAPFDQCVPSCAFELLLAFDRVAAAGVSPPLFMTKEGRCPQSPSTSALTRTQKPYL